MTREESKQQSQENEQPAVSVIVPVYRDWSRLKLCLDLLAAQTIPADQFEVIVVNNDPTDPCSFVLPAPNMRIVEEHVKSSYAARNAGIRASRNAGIRAARNAETRAARADILAFTDSDCLPDKRWIEAGAAFMQENNAWQAGGRVDFIFTNPNSAAELLDASTHMDNERSIARHSCAATANLFVRREVFEGVGFFNDRVQSGGDMEFTSRASAAGFQLWYCPGAVVAHPTRNFIEGLQKAIRVGWGFLGVELSKPVGLWKKAKTVVLYLIPLANPYRVRSTMKRYNKSSRWLFWRTMMLSLFYGLVHDFVFLGSLVAYPFRRKKSKKH
jgi:glycosyltransferase AglE